MALVGYSFPLFMSYGINLWLFYYITKGEKKSMKNKYGFITRAITNGEKKVLRFIALLLAFNMVV